MSLNASYWVQLYFSISPWKSCCTRRLWRERGRWLWLKDQRAVQSQRICRLQDKGATWGKDKVRRMLLLSFHSEMITQGQIVNALLYCSFLRHQRETFVFSSRMKLMLKGGHIAMLVEIKHTADARAINQNKTGEDAQASIFVEDKSGTSTCLINITSTVLDRWRGVLRITSCFSPPIILLQLHVGFICTNIFFRLMHTYLEAFCQSKCNQWFVLVVFALIKASFVWHIDCWKSTVRKKTAEVFVR